jgi:glutamyl-tRNA synthetase
MDEEKEKKVVTRFAPSPTGFMHVGGVRTALYAWLWAKKNNGEFILRIEDTDKNREVEGAISHIMESLKWLGLEWGRGPGEDFKDSEYLQSNRLDIYKKYALKLIEKGLAYPDPFSEEELESLRQKSEKEKKPFLYREYRKESNQAWDGKTALRFKIPEIKEYKWKDVVGGDLRAGPEALDDFILIKKDGYPTYNFAHIIDDIEMGVTHVMRGQEFVSSMPKFLALHEALGAKPPVFVTLPPIMAEDGKKKLSKRDGAKDILEYKEEGYLPEAFVNFLALLGWHPSSDEKEIFTIEELISTFEIKQISRSGAGWDDKKLDWVNKEHIKNLPKEEKVKQILPVLPEEIRNPKIALLLSERISKWSEVKEIVDSGELNFFVKKPEVNKEKLLFKNTDPKQISSNLESVIDILEKINKDDFSFDNIKESLMNFAQSMPSVGEVLHPVRYALSGMDRSPDPFIISEILGKDESIARLKEAL